MNESKRSGPRRWVWFLGGIIFTVMSVGAFSYFVPILDCPMCAEVETVTPEAGDVSSTMCASCDNGRTMTVAEYLKEFPVQVELPKVPKIKIEK